LKWDGRKIWVEDLQDRRTGRSGKHAQRKCNEEGIRRKRLRGRTCDCCVGVLEMVWNENGRTVSIWREGIYFGSEARVG
jgi:hypothetical protein